MLEHITSLKNPKVTTWKSLKDRKGRRETGCFLVEGRKMVEEALASAFPVEAVLVDDARLEEFTLPAGIPAYSMPGYVLAVVCDTKTPQGIAAIVRMAEVPLAGKRLVAMDGVQDPGNVGTIWRTADAFGCDGLILLSGCADPYSAKTVRSSMGAVFRLPVYTATAGEMKEALAAAHIPLYGAALRDDTLDARDVDYTRSAIAIGSEGRGLTEEMLTLCDRTVRIPMAERCESLNAAIAATVLLWEAYR